MSVVSRILRIDHHGSAGLVARGHSGGCCTSESVAHPGRSLLG